MQHHADQCEWHCDQYDFECTCGLTRPATAGWAKTEIAAAQLRVNAAMRSLRKARRWLRAVEAGRCVPFD
jgi:hypothetical protein